MIVSIRWKLYTIEWYELFINVSFLLVAAKRPKKSSEGLITWDVIQTRMPWSLMFLLGGGFAISKGSIASNLARRLGEAMVPLRFLPPALILILISLLIGTITEFTSNVGIANITLPVIAQMVKNNFKKGTLLVNLSLLCLIFTVIPYSVLQWRCIPCI